MYIYKMWPTYLFFISMVIGLLFLLTNKSTKKLPHYKTWQTLIAIIPIGVFITIAQPRGNMLYMSNKTDNVDLGKKELKNGLWINQKDSLSRIEIKNHNWIFIYGNEHIESNNIYKYKLTEQLPDYADTEQKPGEFLILTNKMDTLNYEIMGYNESVISLMHFPSGSIHVYKLKE